MPRASIRLRKPQTSSAVISGGRTEPVIAALLLRVAPLEAAENRALHRADIAVLAQREWLGILDCGLSEHSWSRPTMRPRRPMDEERMAYVHVSGATSCVGAHASERSGGGRAGVVAVPDATLTHRYCDARHV